MPGMYPFWDDDELDCIWVDVDGTLGSCEHRRHHLDKTPRDWDAFFAEAGGDPTHPVIVDLVDLLAYDYKIVICTGRPEHNRQITIDWLDKHGIPWDALYMRPENDFRDDFVVKLELLDKMRADGYNPVFALEDKNSVVRELRKAGVKVLQVEEWDH